MPTTTSLRHVILTILTLQSRTQVLAQRFADLNSLQAFLPATSSDTLLSLLPDRLATTDTNTTDITLSTTSDTDTDPDAYSDANSSPNSNLNPLLKRQNPCNNYISCSSLGAGSLCCAPDRVCSADAVGRIGCCPVGAVCTGTVPDGAGVIPTATPTPTPTVTVTQTQGPVTVTTTTEDNDFPTGGFVIAGSSTVAVLGGDGGNAADGVRATMLLGIVPLLIGLCFA